MINFFPVSINTDVNVSNLEAIKRNCGESDSQKKWTWERIIKEFQFSDNQVSDVQNEQLSDLWWEYFSVLRAGDYEVRLAKKHSASY